MNRPAVRSHIVALLVAICCCAALLLVGGCTPKNAAVGNTRTTQTNVTHDGVDLADITVGVLSAGDASLDRRVLASCQNAGLKAVYASKASEESVAQSAVTNMTGLTQRVVSIVVIPGLDAAFDSGQSADAKSWATSLETARAAGTPVALVNPASQLPGQTLFAASLQIVSTPTGNSRSLSAALSLIINDNPHPSAMNVVLDSGDGKP